MATTDARASADATQFVAYAVILSAFGLFVVAIATVACCSPDRFKQKAVAQAVLKNYVTEWLFGFDVTWLKKQQAWLSLVLEFSQWASFSFARGFRWPDTVVTKVIIFFGAFPFIPTLGPFVATYSIAGTYALLAALALLCSLCSKSPANQYQSLTEKQPEENCLRRVLEVGSKYKIAIATIFLELLYLPAVSQLFKVMDCNVSGRKMQ